MPFKPGRDHFHHKLLKLNINSEMIFLIFIMLSCGLAFIGYMFESFFPNHEYVSFYVFFMSFNFFTFFLAKESLKKMFSFFTKKDKKDLKSNDISFEIELTAAVLAYEVARSDGDISDSELKVLMEEIEIIANKVGKKIQKYLT